MKERGCACRCMRHWGGAALAVMVLLFASGLWSDAQPSPVSDARTGLPIDSELDEDAIDIPREVFHSEALRGRKSYSSNLGNLAFNSPYILGGAARKARISCGTCHVNGASIPKLFIPGLSTHPGTFDTTSSFFNPKTDNGVLDPVAIPSLRGRGSSPPRARWTHRLAARFRAQRHRQRVLGRRALAADSRCDHGLHRGYRFPPQPRFGWDGALGPAQTRRSGAARCFSPSRSRMITT